jgi:hypothetical protein
MKALTIALFAGVVFGNESSGRIGGSVVSSGTMEPVVGAFVILDGTDMGAITDAAGGFSLTSVPVGSYGLRVSAVGHHPGLKADVIVRSERLTTVDVVLERAPVAGGTITVRPSYFSGEDDRAGSSQGFSGEEVRRAPGSAGDVVRIIAGLPSVSKVDNQYNGLAVRGGNPFENGIYIENMEMGNINHFPRQGTSGGGLSMVNVDVLSDVRFSAGAFGTPFGDRLSSVMELDLRSGNRQEFDGQLDFGMSGAGTVLEGPLPGGNGSWLLTARHSWVSLIADIAEIDAVPVYSDFTAKTELDLSPEHRLTFLGMGAVDYVDYTWEQAWEDGNPNFGITRGNNILSGMNWRWLWEGEGFSETSLAYSTQTYGGDYSKTANRELEAVQDSRERALRLRNTNTWQPSRTLDVSFGTDIAYRFDDFDNFYGADTTWSGEPLPPLSVQTSVEYGRAGVFAEASLAVSPMLTATVGARADCSGMNDEVSFSPRGAVSLLLGEGSTITASAGVYRQGLPDELIARDPSFEELDEPSALHAVLGWRKLLGEDTRLVLEAYSKEYHDFPFDPEQPGYFVLDGLGSEQDLYTFSTLESGASASSRGLEVTLHKRLAMGLYGIVSGSWSSSSYRSPGEQRRNRIYDNRLMVGIEGGYKFDERWEASVRWDYAGGRPYTPLDLEASALYNRTILDDTRINAERLSAYHALNLRVDRRFNFSGSALVTYASVWNVYNRRNIAAVYWNSVTRSEDTILQWGIMPVIGLEYEF